MIDMQILPSLKTFGWKSGLPSIGRNLNVGGRSGYSAVNVSIPGKMPGYHTDDSFAGICRQAGCSVSGAAWIRL
tara:strand:- start:34 stop:255 length:222 start_codon:yes stop_codon:yes gene_type:complete